MTLKEIVAALPSLTEPELSELAKAITREQVRRVVYRRVEDAEAERVAFEAGT